MATFRGDLLMLKRDKLSKTSTKGVGLTNKFIKTSNKTASIGFREKEISQSYEEKEANGLKTWWSELQESEAFWKSLVWFLAFCWATNFPVIKMMYDAAPELDPSLYSALRFGVAGLVFLPVLPSSLKRLGSEKFFDMTTRAVTIGMVLFAGYYGQAQGMYEGSTAGKAAFLCTLQIVWVALWKGLENKSFEIKTWASVALAVFGTALLELQGSQPPIWGDLWLMLQPIGFGSGYVLLESTIRKYPNDARGVTACKLLAVGICCIIWASSMGHTTQEALDVLSTPTALQGLTYTALITTAATIWLQSIVFKRVSASDASIIIASEPVWAAMVAFFAMGETMSNKDMIGAILIVGAGMVNELDIDGMLRKDKDIVN